jgi:diamine N-acetyltransferase
MSNSVILRKPIISDLDQILDWENDLIINMHTDVPVFYTPSQVEDFLNSDQDLFLQNQIRYIIEQNSVSVGCIDLYDFNLVNSRAGVGIYIDPNFRNKGFASMSLKLLMSISINQYLISTLYADILAENIASIKVFEKLGFIKTGNKKNWIRTQDTFKDVFFYQCFL